MKIQRYVVKTRLKKNFFNLLFFNNFIIFYLLDNKKKMFYIKIISHLIVYKKLFLKMCYK